MTASPGSRAFGAFTFDVDSGELTGPAGKTRLQPQPALVLCALLEKSGELVTREELKRRVWPETNVEADQGLNYCVRQIRLALGEDGSDGGLIETLPRRGYRLRLPTVSAKESSAIIESAAGVQTSLQSVLRRKLAIVTGIAALILFVVSFAILRQMGDTAAKHLAVMPFNTKGESEWATQLNRDITEQLLVRLANDSAMKWQLVGPATTSRYVDDTRGHMIIGAELKVQYVISGGVRLSDSTLFVQMIRVSDGVHVFAWREKIGRRTARDLANVSAAALSAKRSQLY